MYKEMIISIIIIILIFVSDFITQNYTKNTINSLTQELETLNQKLSEENQEECEKKISELDEKLDEAHKKLAYYIEHNELEKVETKFKSCKSLARSQNYDLAINQVDETIFLLEHISEKYSFNLENIF